MNMATFAVVAAVAEMKRGREALAADDQNLAARADLGLPRE